MTTIWIVPIEPLDSRYTKQWFDQMPAVIANEGSKRKRSAKVRTIAGLEIEDTTTDGAFLDFGMTNHYKASQIMTISRLFSEGKIEAGDKFLITDAWNFVVTAIKYMSDLMDIPVELHGIWHAGAYDPTDILGLKMEKTWPNHQERAWFHAIDYNYFATDFHRQMFLKNLKIQKIYHKKTFVSGQLHVEACHSGRDYFDNTDRENLIVFPHRLNEDKQPKIFEDLVNRLPDEWHYVITQKNDFSKDDLYKVFAQSKMVFSCSLHENLGIGQMEGLVHGCIPVQPNRASYQEMYQDMFKYPSEWTENWKLYVKHRRKLVKFIVNLMDRYDEIHQNELKDQVQSIVENFMYPGVMMDKLLTEAK